MPHSYGWKPDTPDARDLEWHPPALLGTLPTSVDLRSAMPIIYDQGELGSCTANAIAALMQYTRRQDALADFVPSRLFIYYGERAIEGTVNEDSGAMIRDGLKVVAKQGAPPETDWPYDIAKFRDQPPANAYTDALKDRALSYRRVRRDLLKTALASGFPVVVGITVYESFESDAVAQSGAVPMPKKGEQILGGHAVLVVGYDDAKGTWLLRNSWGPRWGQQGYFTLPYAYLLKTHLSSDFWTVQRVGT